MTKTSKAYKDMTIAELFLEKQRLEYWINNSKGNFIGFKQNKKSLEKVKQFILKKSLGG